MSVDDLPHRFDAAKTPVLYHYTSVATARAMVETPAIWLSEHTALNDTSEFSHGRDRLIALMQAREVYTDLTARLYLGAALQEMETSLGLMVGSLTARRDDLSQWRAYADDGAGCVIALDSAYLQEEAGVAMRTVIYEPQTVDKILKAGLTVLQQTFEEDPENADEIMDMARGVTSDLFTIKHPAFSDEREVRICRMLVPDGLGGLTDVGGNRGDRGSTPAFPVRTREGRFGPTRYLILPLVADDGSHAIRGIGLGPAMPAEDAAANEEWFARHDIPTWTSGIPFRR